MRIGSRVRLINTSNIENKKLEHGAEGIVVTFIESKSIDKKNSVLSIGVQFDKHIKGHSCDGLGKYGYCAWISRKKLIEVGVSDEKRR